MIVTITNQKGGVCKTSTAVSLAAELTVRGYKVLLVDTDPQANLSFAVNAGRGYVITDVISGNASPAEAIQKTDQDFYVIPSNDRISVYAKANFDLLANALKPIKHDFDVIIVDTPPTLSGITAMCIKAADLIVIPATPSVLAFQGIGKLYAVIKQTNPNVKISGILLTKYSDRSILNRQLKETAEALAAEVGTIVYDTKIRRTVAMEESFAMQQPIWVYSPKSTAAEDYAAFADEFIKKELS